MSATSGELTAPGRDEAQSLPPDVAPNLTPPPGNPRFPLLDAMRAVAALCVFMGHSMTGTVSFVREPQLYALAAELAYQGVAIFFLLSGFLLYRPFVNARHQGREVGLRDYARRRVLRIVPAYWLALTVVIVIGSASGVNGGNWWVFYGFGQVYANHTLGAGIGVAWTLCVEASFYLVLPLYAGLIAHFGRGQRALRLDVALLLVLSLASVAFRARYTSLLDAAKVSTLPGTFLWFALGMAMAVVSVHASAPRGLRARAARDRASRARASRARASRARASRARHWPSLSWVAAVLAFAALHESPHLHSTLGAAGSAVATYVLYGLAALLLLAPAVFLADGGGVVRSVLRQPWLAWIGLVSYSFYLYHTVVIARLNRFVVDQGLPGHYIVVTVGALAISLAAAAASFRLVERPLMRLGARRSGSPPSGGGRAPVGTRREG